MCIHIYVYIYLYMYIRTYIFNNPATYTYIPYILIYTQYFSELPPSSCTYIHIYIYTHLYKYKYT